MSNYKPRASKSGVLVGSPWRVALGVMATAWCAASAADWPQLHGPSRDNTSPETGLARTWPAGGPKVLWTFKLGNGYGGPAVAAGKVYLLDRVESRQEILRCLDLGTGEEEWHVAYDAPGKASYEGSRSTPSVDDKYVFTVGEMGDVCCFDKATRAIVWQKNLLKEYDGVLPTWACSQSPLVCKDFVVLAPQGRRACLVALEKATGKEIWKSEPMGNMQYSSPMLATIDGMEQVVMMTYFKSNDKANRPSTHTVVVFGADPSDGKTLWTYTGWSCFLAIVTPAAVGDGRFFIMSGYNDGCAMFQVKRSDGKWTAAELFKNTVADGYLHNGIAYKGYLYVNGNSLQKPKNGLMCLTIEGKVKWNTGNDPGIDMGNLVLADGLLYVMNGASGTLYLVEPSPEGYKELARAKVLEAKGKQVWAPMAISGGKLLCRDLTELKCLAIK